MYIVELCWIFFLLSRCLIRGKPVEGNFSDMTYDSTAQTNSSVVNATMFYEPTVQNNTQENENVNNRSTFSINKNFSDSNQNINISAQLQNQSSSVLASDIVADGASANLSLLNNSTNGSNKNIEPWMHISESGTVATMDSNIIVSNKTKQYTTSECRRGQKTQISNGRRDVIVNGRNRHASCSTFSGNVSKFDVGTFSGGKQTNGTQSVSKQNETVEFDMGNKSYVYKNLTSQHRCSGCFKDSNATSSSLQSSKGKPFVKLSSKNDSGSGEFSLKKCKTKNFSTLQNNDSDLFRNDDYSDAADLNCTWVTRRRLITNNKTHRKVTHKDGTTNEDDTGKNDKTEEEKNKQRKQINEQRAKSNEQRAKELELTKYKILNGIHDSPTQPPDTNDDRNIENKTMQVDPSILLRNISNKEPPDDIRDAGVGIVGMDDHPAIEPKNKSSSPNKTSDTQVQNIDNSANTKIDVITKRRILCFGDSITKGFYGDNKTFNPFSNKLEELLSSDKKTEYEVLNFGIPGACASRKMQKRLPEVIKDEKPLDLVILLTGTNDLLSEDCGNVLDLYNDIKNLHERIHVLGVKSVVVTIPDVSVNSVNGTKKMTQQELKEVWNELNQMLRLFVYTSKEHDNMILSDLADEFTRQGVVGGTSMNGMWADKVHLSKAGYDRIGEVIYKDIYGKF